MAVSRPGRTLTVSPSSTTCTPIERNISSVWSRETAGCSSVVSPSANSPARSSALFTCADATGMRYSMPWRAPPRNVSGASLPPSRPSTSAPIRRSGSTMRAIGRERIERSPVITDMNGWPASTPAIRRVVVPLLPVLRMSDGSVRMPPRTVNAPSSCRSICVPSPRSTRSVEARSAPVP